jgi:YVTN family beta-propeller protein
MTGGIMKSVFVSTLRCICVLAGFLSFGAFSNPTITGHVPVSSSPYIITSNTSTNTIYVGHKVGGSNLTVIDGDSDTVQANFPVGIGQVVGLAVNEIAGLLYVSNSDGNLYVVDEVSRVVVGATFIGQSPNQAAYNASNNTVYVAQAGNDTVAVVDGSTYVVLQTINTGDWPWGVVANSTTNTVYVSHAVGDSVSVIDGETNTIIQNIPLGGGGGWMSVNESLSKIYVKVGSPRSVEVIDGATNTIQSTLNRTFEPQGIAVDQVSGRLYISNYLDGTVSVLDGGTYAELIQLPAGTLLQDIEINQGSHKAYVANYGLNTVTVITDTLDPIQLLIELSDKVMTLNLQRGIENSLDAKLDNALSALSDAVLANDASAASALNAFINQTFAQRGGKITESEADGLIADAQAILSLLQ